MSQFSIKSAAHVSILLLVALLTFSEATAQDLKPEEIIAKHLKSIGTKEKRDAAKNRLAAGVSQFESKQPSKKTAGKAVIISDTGNLFFLTSFNSKEYPFEKIGFFAGKATVPFVTAGTRSPLGAFITDHNTILEEGLFGGTISTMWALQNSQLKKAKVSYDGTKKIDGRKMHVLSYYSGGISGRLTMKLFFDAETFRHLRTHYRDEVSPKDQPFGTLGVQGGVKIEMIEIFSDFKEVEGLTLPHSYKIQYRTDSNSGVYEYIWTVSISQYLFNQKLAPDFFKFDDK